MPVYYILRSNGKHADMLEAVMPVYINLWSMGANGFGIQVLVSFYLRIFQIILYKEQNY